jgi:hypothetical protein
MMLLRFDVTIRLPDRPKRPALMKAARQVLTLTAAEIVRASAQWNGRARVRRLAVGKKALRKRGRKR